MESTTLLTLTFLCKVVVIVLNLSVIESYFEDVGLGSHNGLKIFSNCLIIWKQFTAGSQENIRTNYYQTFHILHSSFFNQTPYVHKYYPSPDLFKKNYLKFLKSERSHITKHSECTVLFHEIRLDRVYFFNPLSSENDPDVVVYFDARIVNKMSHIPNFLKENLLSLNYSGVQMYLHFETNANLGLKCLLSFYNNKNLTLKSLPPFVSNFSTLKLYWNNLIHSYLQGITIIINKGQWDLLSCDNSNDTFATKP